MRAVVVVLLVLSVCAVVFASRSRRFGPLPIQTTPAGLERSLGDAGPAVHISKHLDDPHLIEQLTRVDVGFVADYFSYSGFVTVNETYNSNMFYWLFPAQNGDKNAPIIMWLQGGPGALSLFGLFVEVGPLTLNEDGKLGTMNTTWNEKYSMLFVDNPVGSGFSYTEHDAGYSTTEDEVSENLHSALSQFFTAYPQYADNDFYVAGESYAGKYIPAIGYKIHQENNAGAKPTINLKGLMIGDGWCDPVEQASAYAPLAYVNGLMDERQAQVMEDYARKVRFAVEKENWSEAATLFNEMVNGPPDYFGNVTGIDDYFDVRKAQFVNYPDFTSYVNSTDIRKQIHVGNHYIQDGNAAGNALNDDLAKSIKHLLPTLIENYRVMFYNGQWDFICAPLTTETFIPTIEWEEMRAFLDSPRAIWRVDAKDAEVAGYAKQYKSLHQVVVRNAGHILPNDQPRAAYDMVQRFIEQKPF